ncbi:MAG: tetratricopeptide repeat protein [Denitratisoma sp.]|nr:tetratricopeptide repeat protein [Denitratisoma sp.]
MNVGGNSKEIQIPELYNGWQHFMLDIDPAVRPDVVCDARNLATLKGSAYDSVYCSHNLEHYFHHDVSRVLAGFLHVLKDEGFAYIRVPDMAELMRSVVRDGLDIEDVLYQSPAGPIAVMDVIYGLRTEIARSGNDFFAHKTGFTRKSLAAAVRKAGFPFIFTRTGNLEITAVAFKNQPNAVDVALLKLSEEFTAEPDPHRSANPDPAIESANLRRRGNQLLSKGELGKAADCYRQAISINPRYAEAHLNLGFVLREQRLYDDAERSLRQAIQINPELEDAFYILGTIAEEQGNVETAIECFSKAIELNPAFEVAYRDLCRALYRGGHYETAEKTIEKGLSLNPNNADFHYYLGNLRMHEKQFERAIACYEKALALRPDYAEVHSNIGKALMELGRYEESIAWYRKALALDPDAVGVEAVDCLLFARSYQSDFTPELYLAEARRYGEMVMAKARRPYQRWTADPAAQVLRVGMVSADFLSHPVGYFLESVLAHLKSPRLELVAYPTVAEEDDLTARIKPCFSAWHPIDNLGDEAAARRILDDGIHILIDLSGHTSHNRLPVFAWKPAPLQVTWLGYFASTGVPGMDYLLADRISVPEPHQAHFTEKIWYLPDTRLCFTPPTAVEKLRPAMLPARRNGYLTFGCFQNLSKLNDGVLAVWGRIFKALPQARLRLRCKQMDDPAAQEVLLKRFTRAGIASERVKISGPVFREEYLAAHDEIDVILDTFPYPGGTTTCEALWMGVPTLTLAGNTLLARQGASLLTCAGLQDWVAHDEAEYVEKAVALTSDLDRLAQLRAGLRDQVLASPLFDAPRFAANLETALHEMWQSYLGGKGGGTSGERAG